MNADMAHSDRAASLSQHKYKSQRQTVSTKDQIFFIGTLFAARCKIDRRDTEKTNDIHTWLHTFSYSGTANIQQSRSGRYCIFQIKKNESTAIAFARIVHIQHSEESELCAHKSKELLFRSSGVTPFIFSLCGCMAHGGGCISLHTRLISLIWHASNNKRRSF